MFAPKSLIPESETIHFFVVVAKGGIPIWCSLQVKVPKLFQIGPNDLVRVTKDYFFETKRKQNVEKQNFVGPYDALFLCLLVEPGRPFICDKSAEQKDNGLASRENVCFIYDDNFLYIFARKRTQNRNRIDLPSMGQTSSFGDSCSFL